MCILKCIFVCVCGKATISTLSKGMHVQTRVIVLRLRKRQSLTLSSGQ